MVNLWQDTQIRHPEMGKRELDKCTLHMHEMFKDSISHTAQVLAQEPIRAHVSYRYHDKETENFNGFFKHYKSMVKQVIYKAMEGSDDELVITIGEMGANRKYDKALRDSSTTIMTCQ